MAGLRVGNLKGKKKKKTTVVTKPAQSIQVHLNPDQYTTMMSLPEPFKVLEP
jgi:ATP-dependent Clp protease adapter protein ClpS